DNDVTRMQALVDKKKVVVTEAAIRDVLWLDDAEGVDCLPNEEIFAELSMSAQRTSWNEFSLAMASAVTCLSTKDVTDAQDDDAQEPSIPSPTPPTQPPQPPQDLPSTSQRIDTSDDTMMDDESNQGRTIDEIDTNDVVALIDDKEEDKKDEEAKVVENAQVQGRQAESQAEIYKTDMDHASKVLKVVTTASEIVTAANTIISAVEPQVPAVTITVASVKVAAAPSKRRKGVVIRDPEEESTTSSIILAETKSKDKGKGILDVAIDHVKLKAKEDPAVQRYQAIKKKPQTEAQTRKNMMMYLKNVAGFRLDYFKGMLGIIF
nr:hypothetical protein [Tanacetum cinerariifolium]